MEEHDSDHEAEQQVEEGGSAKRTIRRWTQEEHQKLVALVAKQQEAGQTEICWSAIARELPGRTGKQCRHRWVNSCQPFTKRGVWDLDEEHIVAQLHATHGSAWSHIASKLKGRSENSVKNHYNALYRSKYLDSKKESVLANYVKLLREGQPQCVETYEQALEITRVYREQAISRISPGGRLLSQQAVQQQPAPPMQQQQLMQQVGDLGAAFDWQYALQDLAPDGLLAGQAATMASGDLAQLPQLQDGGSGAGWQQPSSSSISRGTAGPSQHEAPGRTLSLLGRTAMFSQMDGLTLAPEVDLSQLLELPAMVPAAGGSTSGAALAPAARGNTQSCPGLPTSGNSQPLGDLLAELGSMPAGGAQQQEVGRGPDAYATWISYSGTGGASPDLLQELQAMQQLPGGASGVVVSSQAPAEGVVVDSSSGLLRMQDLLARAQPAVSGGSGTVSASGHGTVTSPLLQMMQQAAASRDHASMSGKEAGMGRIGEDAALVPQEGGNAQAPGGGVPRARPSRRRSYAELYADSNNVAQMLSQLQDGSRSQPGSSLVAAYGPSSATAVAGAPSSGPISGAQLNLSRNGSTSLGTYAGNKRPSTDLGAAYGPPGFADGPRPSSGPLPGTTLADLAPDGPNSFVQASAGSGSALPGQSVAWGGARDAVFLPPGWAPTPNLNDDNEIDCNLYLAPRAPRVRRVGAAESVSGGPSPTATAAASELPLSGGNTAAVDGPTVSAARRRRHSVAYFPSAVEQPMMGLVATEVDMTDLAAYVPGQNRRRSMSVLPSTSGTLPPPMHMGVSDAPQGRKQRFRRRSTEVYSSGGPLSAGQLLDPSLLTLLTNGSNTNTTQAPPSGTQSGSPLANTFDYFGAMQVDASTLLMHPSQTSVLDTQAPAADGHTGLTPMVSGIDIQATRAASGVLYATTSSVGEPASAMSAPATLHHLGFIYAHAGDAQPDGAAVDPAYWDQLQEALGGLASHAGSNVQQRGGAQQQLASAGASTQLYISTGDVDAAALLDGLEAQAQVAREGAASTHSPAAPHLSAQPSPGQLSAQPSPAHSTGGGGYNAPAARSGQGSPAPSTTDLLGAGRVVTTQGLGAEGSAPGLAHPSSAPARPGIPLLDTNMSVSFNLGRLLSPGSELVSPHLGSLFAAGHSVDVSGGDPVLCELRSLGRDDNSFKERLNIGQQPMSSLDVLLEGSNGEAM